MFHERKRRYRLSMPDLDVLDLLSADHQNLLAAASEAAALEISEISQHLSVERDFLYPEIRYYLQDGDVVVDRFHKTEELIERKLVELDRQVTPESQNALEDAVRGHVELFDQVLPALREQIPVARLQKLAEIVPIAIGSAPTHPHRHVGEGGVIGEVIEDVESVADHVRDRLHPHHQQEKDEK